MLVYSFDTSKNLKPHGPHPETLDTSKVAICLLPEPLLYRLPLGGLS